MKINVMFCGFSLDSCLAGTGPSGFNQQSQMGNLATGMGQMSMGNNQGNIYTPITSFHLLCEIYII